MEPNELADITDAVSRGRLTLAELATISGEELNALHAIGVARLDTGRNEDAATLFAALVTLFPFRARFWRAYGVALQRCAILGEAIAAYDAALALEPEHGMTTCHRAEVAFLLGDQDDSVQQIARMLDHADAQVATRAQALWAVVGMSHRPELAPYNPYDDEPLPEQREADDFTLTDGRTLPLEDSMFVDPAKPTQHNSDGLVSAEDDAFVSAVDIAEATGVHRTLTSVPVPLPEEHTPDRPEGTVLTALARRARGWPMADDEVTLTSTSPAPQDR